MCGQVYVYVCIYVRVYKDVQLKTKLQHIGTWTAAALPPRRLCYRPAIFFLHLCLIALWFPQVEIRRFSKMLFFQKHLFT
jgi:hypothetical protein